MVAPSEPTGVCAGEPVNVTIDGSGSGIAAPSRIPPCRPVLSRILRGALTIVESTWGFETRLVARIGATIGLLPIPDGCQRQSRVVQLIPNQIEWCERQYLARRAPLLDVSLVAGDLLVNHIDAGLADGSSQTLAVVG